LRHFSSFFEDKNKMLLEKHGEAESPKTDEEWEQFYEWFDLEKFFNFVKEKTGFGEEEGEGESSFVLPSDEELLALHEEYKTIMFEKLEEDGETKPLWWDWFSGSENEGKIDGDGDGEEDSEGDGEGDGEENSEGEDGESEDGNGDGEEGTDGEGDNEDEELVKPPWWKDSGRETNSPTPFIMDTLEEEGEDGEGEGENGEGEGDGGGNEPPPPPEKPKVGCWKECTGPCCEILENGNPNSGVVEPWEAKDASSLWIGGPEGDKRFYNTNRGWFQAGAQQTITRDDCLIPKKKYIISAQIQLNRDGEPFGCIGIKWKNPDSCPAFSFMYNNGKKKKWHAILNAPGQKFPLNGKGFDLMRVPFNMPKDFKADGETFLKFRGVGAGVDILFKNVSLKPCNHSPLVDEE